MYILHINSLMKIILKQLWELIFRYRKKIIYWALAFFICQIWFLWLWNIWLNNKVLADNVSTNTQSTASQEKFSARLGIAKFFQKVVYILIYPILVVVGKLVDNSLVYGESFWFDIILWQLWVLVRNIANFALWFIFIFYIFKYLITQDTKHGPKRLIIRAVIAAVWIQASWFIMAALIDISTILTYWIGWLPISVLWTNNNDNDNLKYNPYVLKTVISVDWDNIDSFNVYLSDSNQTRFISECKTFSFTFSWDNTTGNRNELIIWRRMTYYKTWEVSWICYPTEQMLCHIWDQVYKFWAIDFSWHNEWMPSESWVCTGRENFQIQYGSNLEVWKKDIQNRTESEIRDYINAGKILQVWVYSGNEWANFWLDDNNANIGRQRNSPRMNDVLSWWYVWVFTALYWSLLNAGKDLRVSVSDSNSVYVSFLNMMVSLGHMIAIWIPLIVMAVVFMIRICVLWLAITLSPIIILLKAFDLEKSIHEALWVKFFKYLQVQNLIGIIFSPAIMCFAISMSTVLVRLINNLPELGEIEKTPILGWLVELNLAWMWVNIWRMIMSVLWIAITRFLVWAAVKTSAIWKESKVVKSLEDLAKTTLWSIPIIPVPSKQGTKWLWKDSVFGRDGSGGIMSKISNNFINEYNKDSTEAIEWLINPSKAKELAEQNAKKIKLDKYISTINNVTDFTDWTNKVTSITKDVNGKDEITTFNTLSPEEKDRVIEAINKIDENKRNEFGKVAPSIEGTKTRNFDNDKGEYIKTP